MRIAPRHILRVVVTAAFMCAAAAIVYVLPKLIGSNWTDVWSRVAQIGLGTALVILGLWIGGLAVYTIAMTASMPGLSHRKALALNLAGSSASNLLPFGGVVGTGVNVAMVRSWRLSVRGFASSTAVLNVINLVSKLLLPAIAGIALGSQRNAAPWLVHSARIASLLAGVVIVVMVVALFSSAWAIRVDRILRYVSRRAGGRGRGMVARTGPSASGPVEALQAQVRTVFRSRWLGLSFGMIGYILLQWALFWVCLDAVDVGATPAAVFAAFAVERALTLAVLTPSGAGVAEVAAAGLLVALGFSPTSSAAGVLLYRLMVYLAEIPVGAFVLGTWASMRFVRRKQDAKDQIDADLAAPVRRPSESVPSADPGEPSADLEAEPSTVVAPPSRPEPAAAAPSTPVVESAVVESAVVESAVVEPATGEPATESTRAGSGSVDPGSVDSAGVAAGGGDSGAAGSAPTVGSARQLDNGVAVRTMPMASTAEPPRASKR